MGSFRLGSVLGFEIRIDYSWFVIVLLILWTLAQGVFPMAYPQLSTGAYIAMGVVGTLLFFASLLAHELSHSLVARTKGIPVEGITLFIFGGMARTRMEAESPGDEFLVAGVGPLSSVAIAGLFWLIAWGGARTGVGVAVTGVAEYLAEINLVLAIFNLLPGFPLDRAAAALRDLEGDRKPPDRHALGHAAGRLDRLRRHPARRLGDLRGRPDRRHLAGLHRLVPAQRRARELPHLPHRRGGRRGARPARGRPAPRPRAGRARPWRLTRRAERAPCS